MIQENSIDSGDCGIYERLLSFVPFRLLLLTLSLSEQKAGLSDRVVNAAQCTGQ